MGEEEREPGHRQEVEPEADVLRPASRPARRRQDCSLIFSSQDVILGSMLAEKNARLKAARAFSHCNDAEKRRFATIENGA